MTTLQCTQAFLENYNKPARWHVVAERAAVAQYVEWEFGVKFATRFMREVEEIRPGVFRVPAIGSRKSSGWHTRKEAESAVRRIVSAVAYCEGRRGAALTAGGIAVEWSGGAR